MLKEGCGVKEWQLFNALLNGFKSLVNSSHVRSYIARSRENRKNRASDILYSFLSDVQDITRVTKVVKRFRFCVIQSQQYMRQLEEVFQVSCGTYICSNSKRPNCKCLFVNGWLMRKK